MPSRKRPRPKRPVAASPARRHFDLSDLVGMDAAKIVAPSGDDPFQAFMLTLALIFNDLKGLIMFADAFRDYKPQDENEVSASAGEWWGVDMQVHRLSIGLIRELLDVLKAFESQARDPRIAAMFRKTSPQARRDWDALLRVATDHGDEGDREFRLTLVKIRSHGTFHYGQTKPLVDGFRRHFFSGKKGKAYERAFRSSGPELRRARFFFADAAVQSLLQAFQGKSPRDAKAFLKKLRRTREQVYRTLGFLVNSYTDDAVA
jgi:hypothetical protein